MTIDKIFTSKMWYVFGNFGHLVEVTDDRATADNVFDFYNTKYNNEQIFVSPLAQVTGIKSFGNVKVLGQDTLRLTGLCVTDSKVHSFQIIILGNPSNITLSDLNEIRTYLASSGYVKSHLKNLFGTSAYTLHLSYNTENIRTLEEGCLTLTIH